MIIKIRCFQRPTHHSPGDTRCNVVLAKIVEAVLDEQRGDVLNLVAAKGRAVVKLALEHARFAADQLEQLADRHTTRIAVWVHDYVRTNAELAERHVLLVDDEADDALLAVTAAELVADLGPSRLPHEQLDEIGVVVVARYHDLLDGRLDRIAIGQWRLLELDRTTTAWRRLRTAGCRRRQRFGHTRHVLVDKHLLVITSFAFVVCHILCYFV